MAIWMASNYASSSASPAWIEPIIHKKPMHLKYEFAEKAELGSTPNLVEKMNLHISL